MRVPSAKAQIQSSDECQRIVDDDELFVMREVESHVSQILKDIVIRMSHDDNIPMPFRAWRTQRSQCFLRMHTVTADRRLHLFIHHDIDFDTTLRSPLQTLIQPPLLILHRRATQEQLGTQPPIFNVYGLNRPFQRNTDSMVVVSSINVPLDPVPLTLGSVRAEAMRLCDF